jgi:NADH:ubiquinone oxidoreductase subunit 2 (subunit N)
MAFCTLSAISHQKNKKKSSETSIKYLIVQSVASAILLIYISRTNQGLLIKVLFYGGISALLLKVARVPFHSWFISVIKKSSWTPAITLITWQKLAPIYLIMFLLSPLILLPVTITAIMGRTSQLNKKGVIEILALSSIFNLRWIITAITLNFKVLLRFLAPYWASLALIVMLLKRTKIISLNKETFSKHKEWLRVLILTRLAGIPPTIGFLAKWLVLTRLLKASIMGLVTLLLSIRAINLFVYIRIRTNLLIKTKQTKQLSPFPETKKVVTWTLASNVPLLIIAFYG